MEVIFLDRINFQVIDYAFVNTNFQVVIDSVIPQKSNFSVNKEKINANIGDIMVIKSKELNYIGIICSIEKEEDKGYTNVQTNDFISILDIKVKLTSYTGNMALYLYNLIYNAYISNTDAFQKINFLTIAKDYGSIAGSISFEKDTINSITSVLNTLNKSYSIGVFYNLIYSDGKISGVELHISECQKGLILKSNFKGIKNLVISSSDDQSLNKIIFIPSDDNTSHRGNISYYLLSNGAVTTDSTNSLRIKNVSVTSKIYQDSDYENLSNIAKSELLISSFDHSITFDLLMSNKVVVPFKDLNVGDFIEFITPNKTYQTMVTQFIFKNNLTQVGVTLGEYRIKLTDKIKLLSRK